MTPLPVAERDALLESLAGGLHRRGLATPALFALELHRPLGNTLAHSLLGLTPLLAPVLGVARLQQATALLADPTTLDALIERLIAPPAPEAGEPEGDIPLSLVPTKSDKDRGKGARGMGA